MADFHSKSAILQGTRPCSCSCNSGHTRLGDVENGISYWTADNAKRWRSDKVQACCSGLK